MACWALLMALDRSGRNIEEVRRLPDYMMALLVALCRPEREMENIRHLRCPDPHYCNCMPTIEMSALFSKRQAISRTY